MVQNIFYVCLIAFLTKFLLLLIYNFFPPQICKFLGCIRLLICWQISWSMVFNTNFNIISVISWQLVLLVEETGVPWTQRKPPTCRKSLTNFITWCCIEYTSPWTGFELKSLVVIGTDCTSNCKSNYHTITTMTTPKVSVW
jgi:hypothetical protein